jgi:hypothetical protein
MYPSDIWHLHDHGSDWHICAIAGIAHHLRRLGWEVRVTDRIGNLGGVSGPEIDIRASRKDYKVSGNTRTAINRIVGIEVEEMFDTKAMIRKWETYRPYRLECLYVATLSNVRSRPDFGMDELGERNIILIKTDWRDFLAACKLFAEMVV